jgi:GT2 family glycosyltransferase
LTPPAFSVVVPTLGRTDEVRALLGSLARQPWDGFDVVLVDQNADDRLAAVVDASPLADRVRRVKAPPRGASAARNLGAGLATGDVLAFLDDDAEALPDTFERAAATLARTGAALVAGRCVDREGRGTMIRWHPTEGPMPRRDHGRMFVESTLFVRRDAFARHGFDEALGVGTFHGAGEANDLVWRMLAAGEALHYDPAIRVYHPEKLAGQDTAAEVRRIFSHRCGFARYCFKHRRYLAWARRLAAVAASVPVLALVAPRRTRAALAEVLGLLAGVVVR